ncbi:MAG TPA: threonine synthase, partial [Desertimonas sp.]|nr:threonine synthase [Desertimonas sp.]
MRYVSTRGQAPELGFAETLLAGLASDGGLYVPADWPALPGNEVLDGCASYATTAAAVLTPFVGGDIAAL